MQVVIVFVVARVKENDRIYCQGLGFGATGSGQSLENRSRRVGLFCVSLACVCNLLLKLIIHKQVQFSFTTLDHFLNKN